MDYAKHYWRLIDKARSRVLIGYSERHHAEPRCLGGKHVQENIVRLTPEEHFVAHQLLVKMHPGNRKLIYAMVQMTISSARQQRVNKLYGWIRRKLSEARRGKKFTPEHKAKLSAAKLGKPARNKGVPMSEAQRAKMSVALKGRPAPNKGTRASDETRAKQRAAKLGRPAHNRGVPMSAEQKAKISAAKMGTRQSREAIERRIATMRESGSFHAAMRDPAHRAAQAERMRAVWAERKEMAQIRLVHKALHQGMA